MCIRDRPKTRVCDGLMTERTATLLARDLEFSPKKVADDSGVIEKGQFFDLDEVEKMRDNGDIDEGQSITAIHLIQNFLKSEKSAN